MRYAALGLGLIGLGLIGLLVYVNYFSEQSRSNGDLVLDLAWAALWAGVVVMCVGVVRLALVRRR